MLRICSGGRKLNGIIYLHRISDPRMGGTAKKNLRVFREICGDKNLGHVRIVTTNWNLVDEKQGNSRQVALAEGAFKPLTDARAKLCRHDKGLESALSIMSQLIHQEPVTMKVQEELNTGRSMGDTSAGAVIVEEMEEMKKKHNKELEELKKELEDASKANDEELRTELSEERRKLEGMIARVEKDRKTLERTRAPREIRSKPDAGKHKPRERPANRDIEHLRRAQTGQIRNATTFTSAIPSVPHLPERQGDVVGNWQVLHDMFEVIREYSEAGGERLGSFGVVAGGLVGLCLSPFIAAKRAIARQSSAV